MVVRDLLDGSVWLVKLKIVEFCPVERSVIVGKGLMGGSVWLVNPKIDLMKLLCDISTGNLIVKTLEEVRRIFS